MSNGEDRKGQLGLGVARVVSMVIVALLEEGVVCGLRRQTGFPQAYAAAPSPVPTACIEPEVSFAFVSQTSSSDKKSHTIFESL